MQTVFRIAIPKGPEHLGEKPFIPRRVHKKSRGGCLACKRRRVKCDETKPSCGKCIKTNGECVYPTETSPKTLFVDERIAPPTGEMYGMAVDLVGTDLDDLFGSSAMLNTSAVSTVEVRLLQHFQAHTSLTLGNTSCKNVMHQFTAMKAWQHSYLMHIVMAISSAHLKRLHADSAHIRLHRQYSITEAAHWQTGLKLYREQLNDPPKPDFDATIATTFLTIIFIFSLDDEVAVDAYDNVNDDKFNHAINPLAATGGFRALRDVFGEFIHHSIWRAVLMGSDDNHGTFSNSELVGIKGLPPAFVKLCHLDDKSTSENNEYYHIIRLLTPLLCMEPDVDNFTKLIAFSGRTWPNFQPMVLERDPKGLLLLAYWFALLRQVDQWWLTRRAKTECTAIVNSLSQLEDPEINALLPYPASFGRADLSYIWDDPDASANVYERYFNITSTRQPQHP